MPPVVIGGRFIGRRRPWFCSVGFSIRPLFLTKSLVSIYRNIKFLSSLYRNYKFMAPKYALWGSWVRGGGNPISILTIASVAPLWMGGGCGLAPGRYAFAAVSLQTIFGQRKGWFRAFRPAVVSPYHIFGHRYGQFRALRLEAVTSYCDPLSRGVLMAMGVGMGPSKTTDRPAGDRFPRPVYAGRYLATYSYTRELPNFKLVLIGQS